MLLVSPALRCRTVITIVALFGVLAGCGAGEPRSVDPAGVDGLEIPIASPDPRDFVREIDNPYLPLAPGSRWTYESDADPGETVRVEVSAKTRTIAGIAATEVSTTLSSSEGGDGADDLTSVDYFAQDRDGNVWSFGSDDWLAGVEGAQAGLVMPAIPRIGDGFRRQYAAGVAEDRTQVLDTAADAATPFGSWTGVVEMLDTSSLAEQVETRRFYAAGVGLVKSETSSATIELVAYEAGDPQ